MHMTNKGNTRACTQGTTETVDFRHKRRSVMGLIHELPNICGQTPPKKAHAKTANRLAVLKAGLAPSLIGARPRQ